MVEKEALLRVQRGDGVHILPAQLKIEDVKVLSNPFPSDGLRDHNDASLYQPAQHHLCDALLVLAANGKQQLVLEQVVSTFSKGPPGLDLHAQFLQELLHLYLLMERVRFDLV